MAAARTVRLVLLLGGSALLAGALLTTAHRPRAAALSPPLAAPEQQVESAAVTATTLICASPTYDAGLQRVGATVAHTFAVRNAGNHDFPIAAVKTSCGCTTAASRQRSLRPGETAGIEARLSLSNPGKTAATILVFGQDSDQPPLRLQLAGEALADPVALTPNGETHLDLGELAFGSQVHRYLELPDPRMPTWTVTDAPAHLDLAIERVSGQYLRLDFQPQTALAVGPFAAQATLRGGVAAEPTLYRLHLSGTLISDLYFNPAELLLTAESPDTAYVSVQSRIGRPFRIARIETPAGVQVEAANASLDQPTHRLSVTRVETSDGLRGQSLALFAEDPRRAARLHFR